MKKLSFNLIIIASLALTSCVDSTVNSTGTPTTSPSPAPVPSPAPAPVTTPTPTPTPSSSTSFPNGLNGWSTSKSDPYGSTMNIGAGIDGVGYIEMPALKNSVSGYRYAEVYKRTSIRSTELSRNAFEFNAMNVNGGTEFWVGNAFLSGIGGVFICFENNQTDLGCYVAGSHTDAIKLPIKSGNLFDISSNSYMQYELISTGSMARFLNLSNLANSIPLVSSNLSSITSVRYGMFVAESSAENIKNCPQCFANVNANKITITSF
jgi:hypothetical protein